MNREIKFRVWDIENKEMLNVQELDFEPTFYGERIAIRPDQYNDYFDVKYMILMQYTGLHDKNGKEIYEGDTIICKQWIGGNFVDYCIEKGFVEFKDGEFGLHRKQGYYKSLKKLLEYDYELEVTGDIYDNSELLGGE